MSSYQTLFLTLPSGEDIYLFTLRNGRGTEVVICNYGAIITSFRVRQPGGQPIDLVLGFDTPQDYLSPAYLENYFWMGCAVGRYGNRIRDGIFRIDGKEFRLSRNMGNDQLHGGTNGFDKKAWQPISVNGKTLVLRCLSPDGEEGFPGNLETQIKFTLSEADELSYTYTAHCDRPTAINLTHHSYFNLNNGTGTIRDHEIRILASQVLEQDERLVTTGNYLPVKNTSWDFTRYKKISADWDPEKGYDQSFVTDLQDAPLPLVAEAYSAETKIKLKVFSTEPVLHFYSGRWIPDIRGKQGTRYGPYSGFCLETQVHPNAINIPQFPNTILRPDETYHHQTVYSVFTDCEK